MTPPRWPARSDSASTRDGWRSAPAGSPGGVTRRPRRRWPDCRRWGRRRDRPARRRRRACAGRGGAMTADELIDGWQAAWSAQEPGGFEDVCASGISYEDPLTEHLLTEHLLQGIDALAAHAQRLWDGFPDARLERTGER